ncbi:putative HLA class I histocompatibility antigen, alpha chain H [Polyodon spathula]|uniref:putative HLA class I histocompatibility antigen, alpha chain H n=1 Tax=Polyodon spathula TaxID=7913 RepID=UPI001B7E88B1|nr:putative HLA class I histocompatibility antigen, alpha chain H [Polyodon spathula]
MRTHSLTFFYTAVSEGVPEFFAESMVDDVQIFYYDSSYGVVIPRQDWANDSTDPQYWETLTHNFKVSQQTLSENMRTLMKHSNQTKGAHTAQMVYRSVPDITLTQRINESSTVTEVSCHVSGFYPPEVKVRWVSDGQGKLEDAVWSGKLLPNQDGTYQIRKTVILYTEELSRHNYSCQVKHSSFPNTKTLKWEHRIMDCSALAELLEVLDSRWETADRKREERYTALIE